MFQGGDLFDAITQSVKFGEFESASMVADLANALFYLHSRGITHRDLKPENLLVKMNTVIFFFLCSSWSCSCSPFCSYFSCSSPPDSPSLSSSTFFFSLVARFSTYIFPFRLLLLKIILPLIFYLAFSLPFPFRT